MVAAQASRGQRLAMAEADDDENRKGMEGKGMEGDDRKARPKAKRSLARQAAQMIAGLGEPVFDKLEADLAKAMMSLPAVKGVEIGSGFAGVRMTGSSHNDPFVKKGDRLGTTTNFSGGIQGGISNGEPIVFRVAFKPVATIAKAQATVTTSGEPTELAARGRHDPCVLPRAVPMVEAMTWLVLCDHALRQHAQNCLPL